jgi:hypothetical protein
MTLPFNLPLRAILGDMPAMYAMLICPTLGANTSILEGPSLFARVLAAVATPCWLETIFGRLSE